MLIRLMPVWIQDTELSKKIYYLWVHDENHWMICVNVVGYKIFLIWVTVNEVHFDKLPVSVSTIQDAPVYPTGEYN